MNGFAERFAFFNLVIVLYLLRSTTGSLLEDAVRVIAVDCNVPFFLHLKDGL